MENPAQEPPPEFGSSKRIPGFKEENLGDPSFGGAGSGIHCAKGKILQGLNKRLGAEGASSAP